MNILRSPDHLIKRHWCPVNLIRHLLRISKGSATKKIFLKWCTLVIVKADSSPIIRNALPLKRMASMKTSVRFTTSVEHHDKEWSVSPFFKLFPVTFCQGNWQSFHLPSTGLYQTEEKGVNYASTRRSSGKWWRGMRILAWVKDFVRVRLVYRWNTWSYSTLLVRSLVPTDAWFGLAPRTSLEGPSLAWGIKRCDCLSWWYYVSP